MSCGPHPFDAAKQTAIAFDIPTPILRIDAHKQGLIHATFVVSAGNPRQPQRFILQRMNQHVFAEPSLLMENVERVLAHLEERAVQSNDDAAFGGMVLIRTREGASWLESTGQAWRMFQFIEGSVSIDRLPTEWEAYQIGRQFARFLNDMSDFETASLHTVLPGYRNTQGYLAAFRHSLDQDALNRASEAQDEIRLLESSVLEIEFLQRLQLSEGLPCRAIHGDAKLNNVLLDEISGTGICVIDLDTVMPGLLLHDLCDCLREALSVGVRDEHQTTEWDARIVGAMVRGFTITLSEPLSTLEVDSILTGVRSIALELGVRFLADHLSGDKYFNVASPLQNLQRARQQLILAQWLSERESALRRAIERSIVPR